MAKLAVCVSVMLVLIALSQGSQRIACCTKYQERRIPLKFLKNYTIQEDTGGCHLKAILFTVKPNKVACGDPYEPWVIEAMKAILKRLNGHSTQKRSAAIQ